MDLDTKRWIPISAGMKIPCEMRDHPCTVYATSVQIVEDAAGKLMEICAASCRNCREPKEREYDG